jgi:hypothetical protein
VQAWITDNFSEEEGGTTIEGKTVVIHGTKSEVRAIARFMAEVAQHLERASYCHMHLRDSMAGWSKAKHVDLEVTVDERTA